MLNIQSRRASPTLSSSHAERSNKVEAAEGEISIDSQDRQWLEAVAVKIERYARRPAST